MIGHYFAVSYEVDIGSNFYLVENKILIICDVIDECFLILPHYIFLSKSNISFGSIKTNSVHLVFQSVYSKPKGFLIKQIWVACESRNCHEIKPWFLWNIKVCKYVRLIDFVISMYKKFYLETLSSMEQNCFLLLKVKFPWEKFFQSYVKITLMNIKISSRGKKLEINEKM